MATLQQTLRGLPAPDTQMTRGPGGVLQQKKTLQEVTQQAGLAAAPTTPAGAQMLGADAQSAKMAGTPQQLGAALKQASEPQQLGTALRRQQVRTQATGLEQQRLQKSAEMQGLGGLGDRVTNFIDKEMQKLAATPVQVKAVGTFEGKDISGLAPDLELLRKNPNDMEAMVRVQSALGMDTTKQLTPEQINGLYESSQESIGRAAGAAISDSLSVSDLAKDPQFGYDMTSLSQLLGVPEAELAGYSVNQLSDKINQIAATEFGESAQMQQQAVSPMAGAAEREMARQAGRELSAVGIRSTEADVQKLADTLERADIVSFGGMSVPVGELLKDENISAIIKDYLESPEGSDIRKELDATEPELSNFIKTHQAALSDAAKQMGEGATAFKQIQESNKKLVRDSFGGIDLLPEVKKALIPQATALSATTINPADSVVLSHLQNKTPDQKRAFGDQLNAEASKNPSVAEQVAKLSPEELSALNIENDGKRWRTYKDISQDYRTVTNLEPTEHKEILANYSPSIDSAEQVNADIEYNNIATNLGFGDPTYTTGTLPIKDNKVDVDSLKTAFINNNPMPTIAEAAAGKTKSAEFTYKEPAQVEAGSAKDRILKAFGDYGRSGKIPTFEEIEQRMVQTGTNILDLVEAGTLSKWGIDYNQLMDYMLRNLKDISFSEEDLKNIGKDINLDLGQLSNMNINLSGGAGGAGGM